MLELVRQTTMIDIKKFNDMNDFDMTVTPRTLFDDLKSFNEEFLENQLEITSVENKCIKIIQKPQKAGDQELFVKVKFY